MPEINRNLQRHLVVSTYESTLTIHSLKPLTYSDRAALQNLIEEYIVNKKTSDAVCNQNLGLVGLRCIDAVTCTKVCSTYSLKCNALATNYADSLGYSILDYSRDQNDLSITINTISTNIGNDPSIELDDAKKRMLVENLNRALDKSASIYANPIYNPAIFDLCQQKTYKESNLRKMMDILANYTREPSIYKYQSSIKLTPISKEERYAEITITETISPSITAIQETLASPKPLTIIARQPLSFTMEAVRGSSSMKYLFFYWFHSNTLPSDSAISTWQTPAVTTRLVGLENLWPVQLFLNANKSLYGIFINFTDYYISLAVAFSLWLILLIIILTISHAFLLAILGAMKGRTITSAIRPALGRPNLRWDADLMVGIALMIVGVIASYYAPGISEKELIYASIMDNILESHTGLLAFAGMFFGMLLAFVGIENRVKLIMIEKLYQKEAGIETKEFVLAKAEELKKRFQQLKEKLDMLSKAGFDISEEYDLFSTIPIERINELSKKKEYDPLLSKLVADSSSNVENALARLDEKKRSAEENWPSWEDTITMQLSKAESIHLSNLLSIPSQLRPWAVKRYITTHPEKGLLLDGDVVKRLSITPEHLVSDMMDKGMLDGAVLLKAERPFYSQIKEGNKTVVAVLSIKLLSLAKTISSKLSLKPFSTIAIIGDRTVAAVAKQKDINSILFIRKDRYKEALDEWKEKGRLIK